MKTNREKAPILGKYVRRDADETAIHDVSVLQHTLAVVEPEEAGYDPYDNPGPPPTPKASDEPAGRRRVLKRRGK